MQSTSLGCSQIHDSIHDKSNEICCSEKESFDFMGGEPSEYEFQTTAKELRPICDEFESLADDIQVFV